LARSPGLAPVPCREFSAQIFSESLVVVEHIAVVEWEAKVSAVAGNKGPKNERQYNIIIKQQQQQQQQQ
jgi:hypothetical protein